MKKISTLFKKDPKDLGKVINEVNPENQWVFDGESIPTRKYDGTACAIIDGLLYKRYDVKKGRQVPDNAIPCQEADEITGHWPHWVECDRNNSADIWHFKAFDYAPKLDDGTYELCGPKIQGNPEKLTEHYLVKHGAKELIGLVYPMTFDNLKQYLEVVDIEGIVFHHKSDDRMCKLRKSDFGIKR
jgi:hypothetical protein